MPTTTTPTRTAYSSADTASLARMKRWNRRDRCFVVFLYHRLHCSAPSSRVVVARPQRTMPILEPCLVRRASGLHRVFPGQQVLRAVGKIPAIEQARACLPWRWPSRRRGRREGSAVKLMSATSGARRLGGSRGRGGVRWRQSRRHSCRFARFRSAQPGSGWNRGTEARGRGTCRRRRTCPSASPEPLDGRRPRR